MNEKTLKDDYTTTSIESVTSNTTPDDQSQQQPHQLSRGLKARHIQMIALGGTIGKKTVHVTSMKLIPPTSLFCLLLVV